MEQNNPLISVVTVSYNAVSTIEQTILSVIDQTYSNIEYIIIDGGSTDGTVDIIKKYAGNIAYWVSEPDKGIYDAMNKGGLKATGEWIHFLNCGDRLYKKDVMADIFLLSNYNDAGILYMDMVKITRVGTFLGKPYPLEKFDTVFPVFHPSSYIRRNVFIESMFDTSYRIAADFALYRQLYFQNIKFKYFPITMVIFDGVNGISSISPLACYREEGRILGYDKKKNWLCKYVAFSIRLLINKLIKGVIIKIAPSFYSKIVLYKMKKNSRYREFQEFID